VKVLFCGFTVIGQYRVTNFALSSQSHANPCDINLGF